MRLLIRDTSRHTPGLFTAAMLKPEGHRSVEFICAKCIMYGETTAVHFLNISSSVMDFSNTHSEQHERAGVAEQRSVYLLTALDLLFSSPCI